MPVCPIMLVLEYDKIFYSHHILALECEVHTPSYRSERPLTKPQRDTGIHSIQSHLSVVVIRKSSSQ